MRGRPELASHHKLLLHKNTSSPNLQHFPAEVSPEADKIFAISPETMFLHLERTRFGYTLNPMPTCARAEKPCEREDNSMKIMCAFGVLAIAGTAAASTFTQTVNWDFPLSPGNTNISYLGFQSIPGWQPGWVLDSVQIELDAIIGAAVTAENDSPNPAPNFGVDLTGFATFSTSGLNAVAAIAQNASSGGVGPSDGIAGSGPDFHDFGTITGNGSANALTLTVAAFDVAGSLNGTVNGQGGFSFSGTTDASLTIANFAAEGVARVTYNYTIPTPGAAAILGLAGLAATRRRR